MAHSIPPYARLHELRRHAKNYLKHALEGDQLCLAEFDEISKEPTLAAALLLVARQHGFSSWAKLKHQVERNAADPRTEIVRRLVERRDRMPVGELCAVISYEKIVAASVDTTVAVSAVRVFKDRCQLDLGWVTRREVDFDTPRISLTYADGRETPWDSTEWVAAAMARPGLEVPELRDASGSDGPHGGRRIWLWPLPPPGDLRITVSWPRAGIPEGTSAVLDATPIQAAARRVRSFTLGSPDDDAPPEARDSEIIEDSEDGPADRGLRQRLRLFESLPDGHLYTVVPVGEVVARSSRLAVAIHAIRVHRTGCLLDVEWIAPKPENARDPYAMAVQQLFERCGPYVAGRQLCLRFGVEFADGRSVEYGPGGTRWPGGVPSEDPPAPHLVAVGGSFVPRTGGETVLMLAPLPPPGELRFRFSYPELGVPETVTILDGTAINQAAARIKDIGGSD